MRCLWHASDENTEPGPRTSRYPGRRATGSWLVLVWLLGVLGQRPAARAAEPVAEEPVAAEPVAEEPVAAGRPVAWTPDDWSFDGGTWTWKNGALRQRNTQGLCAAFLTSRPLADARIRVRFRVEPDGEGVRAAGLILRSQDSRHGYYAHLDTRNRQIILTRRGLGARNKELTRRRGIPLECSRQHAAVFQVAGGRLTVSLDGAEILSAEDAALTCGVPGVYTSPAHYP